jgi:glycosyltransferase involved in cell wall biosynthesis
MKVLSLTDIYPSTNALFSGIFVRYLNEALSKHLEIILIHPHPWPQATNVSLSKSFSHYEQQGRIQVYRPYIFTPRRFNRIFIRGLFFFLTTFKLLLEKRKVIDFDVIHAHMTVPAGFAGVILSKIYRKPALITCHGSDINIYPQTRVLRQFARFALKKSDLIVTVSNNLKNKVQDLDIKSDKIKVIQNGVDSTVFKIEDKEQARGKLGITDKEKIILYVGQLSQAKGLDYLLRAFGTILTTEANVYLYIIGDGTDAVRLRTTVKSLSLERKVFLTGPRPNHEIPKWLAASDLLCLPSLNEGLPCVILEALSSGRPVVATNVGGIPEILDNDATLGIMVPPKDEIALAEALTKALNTQWSAQQISSKVSDLSWEKVAEKYSIAFQNLVSSKN